MRADHPLFVFAALAGAFAAPAAAVEIPIAIDLGSEITWGAEKAASYQVQYAARSDPQSWADLGPRRRGDGSDVTVFDPDGDGTRSYRVLQIAQGAAPAAAAVLVNGGFEKGNGKFAIHWNTAGSRPPARSARHARRGLASMHCKLANVGSSPQEAILWQSVRTTAGTVQGGANYTLTFWIKQVSGGPSYLQQYQVNWLDATRRVVRLGKPVGFSAEGRNWAEIKVPDLVAPPEAADVMIMFRFVTGAVENDHGETYLDDVSLVSSGSASARENKPVKATAKLTSRLTWPTKKGWLYQPFATTIDESGARSSLRPRVVGDGSEGAMEVAPRLVAELSRIRGARLSLLPVGEVSVGGAGKGALGLSWKKRDVPRIGYLVLHGREGGALDKLIWVKEGTGVTIENVAPGEPRRFAVLAIRTPPALRDRAREVPVAPPAPRR